MTKHVPPPQETVLPSPIDMNTLDVREANYFPTQVFSVQLPDTQAAPLNARLLELIQSARAKDEAGIQRSNFRALGGWHSQNHLHREPEYAPLVSLIGGMSDHISTANGYSETHRLEIGTMWSIVNPPGSFNRAHIHPSCLWSGVYYVQTPPDCGKIEFIDPRTQNHITPPKFQSGKRRPRKTWSKVRVTPEPGKLLIFPSWLFHGVDPNLCEEEGEGANRVIVSFNLNQRRAG